MGIKKTHWGYRLVQCISIVFNRNSLVYGGLISVGMLSGCSDGERGSHNYRKSVNSDLAWINSNLSRLEHATTPPGIPMAAMLSCPNASGNKTLRSISLDKVLDEKKRELLLLEPGDLVSLAHRGKGTNADDAEVLEKWGSSYSTWCMSFNDWRLALTGSSFLDWTNKSKGRYKGRGEFPIIWEDREEMYGDRVILLEATTWTGLWVYNVDRKIFENTLVRAREWLRRPEGAEEVSGLLKAANSEMRAHGVLSLGAKRVPQAVEKIAPFVDDKAFRVRWAAIWALGALRYSDGIQTLARASSDGLEYFPSGMPGSQGRGLIRDAIVKSLASIGGDEAVDPLLALWEGAEVGERPRFIQWALETIDTVTSRKALEKLKGHEGATENSNNGKREAN